MYDNATVNKQGKAISINVKGNEFTLVDDGTMEEGKLAYLDIADGNIDLYSNGYKQYTGNLQGLNKNGVTEYTGKYIITGTTTENTVNVREQGTYNITIKNLQVDVSNYSYTCAFNANLGRHSTNCYVTLKIEGDNLLQGGSGAAGLGFTHATPNMNGVNDGSSLTINGNGKLEVKTKASYGIGSGWGYPYVNNNSIGNVSNIIINSGNIIAEGSGRGIGCASSVDNIVINGGKIITNGIGGKGESNSIIINDGIIYSERKKWKPCNWWRRWNRKHNNKWREILWRNNRWY